MTVVSACGAPYGDGDGNFDSLRNQTDMTPIAAYYILVAQDHERELARKRQPARKPRPSLIDRARRVAAGLRPTPRLANPA
jgi:hypothetical protein